VGLSGGIDSAVSVALCVKALGREKVLGLILPERESNPVSADYARRHAERLGITWELLDITPVLDAFGTYSGGIRLFSPCVQATDPDAG